MILNQIVIIPEVVTLGRKNIIKIVCAMQKFVPANLLMAKNGSA